MSGRNSQARQESEQETAPLHSTASPLACKGVSTMPGNIFFLLTFPVTLPFYLVLQGSVATSGAA